MGRPITWQNINIQAAPESQYQRPMNTALLGINTGFDKLTDVFNQYETGQVNKNTNQFQNEIAKYRTPEELQAAQDSGAVAALQERFGMQMDQNIRRNGVQQTLDKMRAGITSGNVFADAELERVMDPTANKITRKIDLANLDVKQAGATLADTQAGTNQKNAQASGLNLSNTIKQAEFNEWGLPINVDVRNKTSQVNLGDRITSLNNQVNLNSFEAANRDVTQFVSRIRADIDSGKTNEKNGNAAINTLVLDTAAKKGLSSTFTNQLLAAASVGMDGVKPTAARIAEQTRETAEDARVFKEMAINNGLYQDQIKPAQQQSLELMAYVDSKLPENGSFDANPRIAKEYLASIIGTNMDVVDADGKKLTVPITPYLIRLAMDAGGINKRNWLAGGGQQFEPGNFQEQLRVIAKSPSYITAVKEAKLLRQGNSANIREAWKKRN